MTIIWIALGAFVGWSVPQPEWAKSLQKLAIEQWIAFKSK